MANAVLAQPTSRLSAFTPNTTPRLFVSTEAYSGAGKTRFGLTAPGPTGYFSLDRGFEDARGGANALDLSHVDKGDYSLDAILSREEDVIAATALEIWDAFTHDWAQALLKGRIVKRNGVVKFEPYRTVVADTGTELWQLLRLARFGRVASIPPTSYPDLNSEFRSKIIKPAYASSCNVVIPHKLKDERKNTVGIKPNGQKYEISTPTGLQILDGFGDFRGKNSYAAPITVRQSLDLTLPIPERYQFQVVKCAPNPELDGLELSGMDFPMFASLVYQDVPPEYWQQG